MRKNFLGKEKPKLVLKANIKKKLDLSKLVPNVDGRYSARGMGSDQIWIRFSYVPEKDNIRMEIRIGTDILDDMGLNVNSRFALYHDPDNKRKFIMIPSDNGIKCHSTDKYPKYTSFRQTWRDSNAYIIPEEQRNTTFIVEYEIYENALLIHAP